MKTLEEYLSEIDARFRQEDVRIAACCETCYRPISSLGNPSSKPEYCLCGSKASIEEVKLAFDSLRRQNSRDSLDPVDVARKIASQR